MCPVIIHLYQQKIRTLKSIFVMSEHYMLDYSKKTYKINVHYKEKLPLVFQKNDNNTVTTFDGKELKTLSYKVFKKEKFDFSSPYIWIPVNDHSKKKCTLKEYYKEFVDDAAKLKAALKGEINLFKTGSDYKTALNLFNKYTKDINPDRIKPDEAYWLEKCTTGAIITATNNYTGPGYKYDFNSMLQSVNFMASVKEGEFKEIDKLEDI